MASDGSQTLLLVSLCHQRTKPETEEGLHVGFERAEGNFGISERAVMEANKPCPWKEYCREGRKSGWPSLIMAF